MLPFEDVEYTQERGNFLFGKDNIGNQITFSDIETYNEEIIQMASIKIVQNRIVAERCKDYLKNAILEVKHKKNETTNLYDLVLILKIPTPSNIYAYVLEIKSIYAVEQNIFLNGILENTRLIEVWSYDNVRKTFPYISMIKNIETNNNGFLGKISELNLPNIWLCERCGKMINKSMGSKLCPECSTLNHFEKY